MLNDVTTDERMDNVSSVGYALGYIGSCVPFIISLGLVLIGEKIGFSISTSMMIAFILNAVWWIAFTIPIAISYKQKSYIEKQDHVLKQTFGRLYHSLKNAKKIS